jgi:hypothetical protein
VAEALLPNKLGLLNTIPALRDDSGAASHVRARWGACSSTPSGRRGNDMQAQPPG